MSGSKITWKELFDLSDDADIKEAIIQINKLNSEYENLSKNIVKQTDKIDNSYNSLIQETKDLTTSTDKLTTSQKDQTEALAKQSTATDEVFKKAKKLAEAKENARKLEDLYGKSVDSLNARLKAQTLEFNQLNIKTEEGAKSAEKLGKKNRELKQEIKDLTSVARTQNNVFERTENSYDSMTKANNKLKAELRQLPNSFDRTNKKAEDLRKQIAKNTAELKEWDAEIGDNFRNVGDYGIGLDGLAEKFAGLAGGGGMGGVISGLGGMVPQLAVAGAAIGAVAAGVDALNELTKELRVQLKAVSDTLGLVDEEGEKAAAGIRATAVTFDQEFNEVLRASNTLMETFGMDAESALDIINKGFVAGANSSEELLDSIKEYSVHFKDSGLEAKYLVGIIDASADAGIFSDKGVDVVKEFKLRIKEATSATSDALAPLGKYRQEQIQIAVEAGNIGEAMGLVTNGLKEVDLTASQTQTIIADVFGGPGEDVGEDFLFTIGDIVSGQKDMTEGWTDLQKAQLEVLQVNQDFEASLVEMASRFTGLSQQSETFWTRMKTFGVDVLIAVFDAIQPIINAFSELWSTLKKVFSIFSFLNKAGGETSLLFKAIGLSIKIATLPLLGLIKGLNWLYDIFNRFILQTAPIQKALGFIEVGFNNMVEAIKKVPRVMNGLINAFKVGFTELKGLVLEQGEIIQDAFFAIFDPTKSVKDVLARSTNAFRDYGAKIKQAFIDGYNQVEPTFKVLSEDRVAPPKAKEAAAVVTTTGKKAKKDKKKELEDLQAIIDSHEKRRLSKAKQAIKNRLAANKTESNLLVAQLQKRYNDGEISKENFEAAKSAIEKQYSDLSLKNEKDALNNLIDLNIVKGNELVAVKKRLSEIELAQNAVKNEKVVKEEKSTIEDIIRFGQQGFDAIVEFGSKILANRVANSEFLLEKNEIDRQRAVELAGDNEEQIRIINEKADEDRIKLEDKRRKAQEKQAKLDKANALITIAINTAVAISKVAFQTGVFSLVAAIPVAALGALQLATVAAQPIPQFYKGTDNAPGGLAEVAERGAEIIVSPDGKIDYVANRQIRHVEKGSKVLTNSKTMEIERAINDAEISDPSSIALNQLQKIERDINVDMAKMIAESNEKTIKAIKEMERFSFEGTSRGIRAFAENAKGRTELINDRYS